MSDIRYFSASALLSLGLFSAPAAALTSSVLTPSNIILTHIYTSTTLTKPASSFAQLDKSYKIAGVCFLGTGRCSDISFGSGDQDYTLDTAEQCKNEGYKITSCVLPSYLYDQCPHNDKYYKSCQTDTDRACKEAGYDTSCEDGYVKDEAQICPYNSSYYKCKCNPCDGYTYTYAEATASGYVADGSCNNCGTTKYKRKENPCSGYLTCECGGEIGTSTCISGTKTKYKVCKTCCEYRCSQPTCPTGYICEKEACSNKYCITGCAVDYTDWCTQPITDCGALGYTKTADQCPNGYLKCPYGETVFCPTETKCTIGDIYYSDNTCSSADNYNNSKTALGVVVYVTDNGKHGQIISAETSGRYAWGTYGVSSLPAITLNIEAAKDFDSCGNTDKIIAAGNSTTHPAAWAARNYARTAETEGKWCLPSAGIMANVYMNTDIINNSISKLNGTKFTVPENYETVDRTWTSTVGGRNDLWVFTMDRSSNNGLIYHMREGDDGDLYNYLVRPVLEF